MALIEIEDMTIGFRGPPLLEEATCQIEAEQRIGLLGRNGAGKTTLMRLILGKEQPDHGQIRITTGTKLAFLPQDVPHHLSGSIRDIVLQGWRSNVEEPEETQVWKAQHAVDQILSRMELDETASFAQLSSGMKRRVLLAQALVSTPDVLLLDEPTNHLDLTAINWLEEFLTRWKGTIIFVTHDRRFLRTIAKRILEIDRGHLFDWSCDYDTFLERKEAALEAEQKQQDLFDKRLAQEEAWIRQGIKARRTRNEGRVKALKQLRRERSERQSSPGKVNLRIEEGRRSGNLIAEVKDVSFSYESQEIVSRFSTTIMRGDKIGVIGPNGAGKTTLLRILLGQLTPQSGQVRLGTNLEIAYFDQLREQLDEEQTVQENVGEGSDTIRFGDKSKHVIGYLQDFLFSPERARTPIRFLSGGERNRVLLARLFSKPANVIVLDEPTNDLDAETLELLEEKLIEFNGTILLVSHDREFLNNVVTSTIAFESDGVREYVGGYDDWLRQRTPPPEAATQKKPGGGSAHNGPPKGPRKTAVPTNSERRRLSYKERRELEELPERIEQLERKIAIVHEAMADPSFYQQDGESIATEHDQLKKLEEQLALAYHRWDELEQLA